MPPRKRARWTVQDISTNQSGDAPVASPKKDAAPAPGAPPATSSLEPVLNLLHCTICLDLLALPAILKCGHTFCSPCLHSHLSLSRKWCPTCRAHVSAAPVPNMALQDILHAALPHVEPAHSAEIESRATAFRALETPWSFLGGSQQPILDLEDGVLRCPTCLFELEGGECNQCGAVFSDVEGFEENFDDLEDGDLTGDEMVEMLLSGQGDGEMDDDESETDDSFIVGDDIVEFDGSGASEVESGSNSGSETDGSSTSSSTPPKLTPKVRRRINLGDGSSEDEEAGSVPETGDQSPSASPESEEEDVGTRRTKKRVILFSDEE